MMELMENIIFNNLGGKDDELLNKNNALKAHIGELHKDIKNIKAGFAGRHRKITKLCANLQTEQIKVKVELAEVRNQLTAKEVECRINEERVQKLLNCLKMLGNKMNAGEAERMAISSRINDFVGKINSAVSDTTESHSTAALDKENNGNHNTVAASPLPSLLSSTAKKEIVKDKSSTNSVNTPLKISNMQHTLVDACSAASTVATPASDHEGGGETSFGYSPLSYSALYGTNGQDVIASPSQMQMSPVSLSAETKRLSNDGIIHPGSSNGDRDDGNHIMEGSPAQHFCFSDIYGTSGGTGKKKRPSIANQDNSGNNSAACDNDTDYFEMTDTMDEFWNDLSDTFATKKIVPLPPSSAIPSSELHLAGASVLTTPSNKSRVHHKRPYGSHSKQPLKGVGVGAAVLSPSPNVLFNKKNALARDGQNSNRKYNGGGGGGVVRRGRKQQIH